MATTSYNVTRNVEIPMRDGTRLRADLWLPRIDGSDRPVPAILYRTPYDKSQTCPDFLRPQHCAEAGFAAVVQDTRGRFASGGNWRPVMWEQEGLDGYDSVEWIAAQGWCSGAVGMAGPSYLGIAQLVAAAQKPPHLKAIAPAMTSTLEFDRIETGGALRLDHVLSWVAFMALDWMQKRYAAGTPPTPEQSALVLSSVHDPRGLFEHRPLRDLPLFKLPGFPISFDELVEQLTAGQNIDAADIGIPTLHAGGWYDVFARSTVGLFQRQANAGRGDCHLLMGCWTHAGTLPQYHGQINFGIMASGAAARVHEQHLAFFRRHLRGETAAVPRVRYFLMNADTWHETDSWPPPSASVRRLHLRADRDGAQCALSAEPPSLDHSSASYVYDPADPTPTCGGRVLYLGRLAMGPIDQAPLQHRTDLLRYFGEPQAQALDLAGPVTARLHVASSAVDTDFIVRLLDAGPDGVMLPMCEGALRLRWREGFDAERAYTPGRVEAISISLGDVAWRVAAGHCLVLQVQSANYPHLDPNFNTGGALGADARGVAATNQVFHDREHPSWLELSVLQP
jgi:hypothetical protein